MNDKNLLVTISVGSISVSIHMNKLEAYRDTGGALLAMFHKALRNLNAPTGRWYPGIEEADLKAAIRKIDHHLWFLTGDPRLLPGSSR